MDSVPEKSQPAEQLRHLHDAAFCIVAANFNSDVVDPLIAGAVSALERNGVRSSAIEIVRVPGAFEVPLASKAMAQTGRFDGIVALAAIVRGGTPHFEYVSAQSIAGLGQVSLECNIPVGNGILTTDTMQQAVDRAGGPAGHKGEEAALAVLEMVQLLRKHGR